MSKELWSRKIVHGFNTNVMKNGTYIFSSILGDQSIDIIYFDLRIYIDAPLKSEKCIRLSSEVKIVEAIVRHVDNFFKN